MSKDIQFSKLSGAGNDFVIIDNRDFFFKGDVSEFVRKVSRRGMSVGADGVILVEPSANADFKMRYFNSDGSEGETCGNGSRCIARFAYLKGIAKETMTFETIAGMYQAVIQPDGRVKVQVSNPKDLKLNITLPVSTGNLLVHFINTGVPHAVIPMEQGLDTYDVFNLGREIRNHKAFAPAGTNANFIQVLNEREIRVRTYERGVENETLACGTGSIAAAIIMEILGKAKSPVSLITQSGQVLTISFERNGEQVSNVFLAGEARLVFDGVLNDEALFG